MALGFKYCCVFVLLLLVFLSGTLMFLKGFLLSRTVLPKKSECESEFSKVLHPPNHKHEIEGCWMHGRFRRAILIIIDALRYDFIVYNSSMESEVPYLNKFPSIDYLITRKPLHSRLYKFMADPPTSTMQRLKGLMTGSLPTFVDVGSNFDSYEVKEDNILSQLKDAERRVTFLGDDTWLGLFPKVFKKSFDFPSFDVKDLHTVDNGILKHLYPEMRKQNWDVIIAHFLGVDHCGHRYGPNHPAMAEKLSQMDTVIRSVTNLMKSDTVLFVMGDHGMTRTGDHGGDSEDELTAGMFVYSPTQLASTPQKRFDNTVAQTDLVPTLALLLGIPIPYSNLGMVIPELFSHCPWWHTESSDVKKVYHKVKALRLNALQVHAYLDSYFQVSTDLPRGELRSLEETIKISETSLQALMSDISSGTEGDMLKKLTALESNYISFLTRSRKMCERVWAKFDMKMILAGIMTLVLGIVLTIYFFLLFSEENESKSSTVAPFIVAGTILHLLYTAIHVCLLPSSVPPLMIFIISLVLIFICYVSSKVNIANLFSQPLSFDGIITHVVVILSCLVYFSNSFIVYEDKISLFLLQTLLFTLWLKIAIRNHNLKPESSKSTMTRTSKKSKYSFDIFQYVTEPSHLAMIFMFAGSMFLRLSSNFYACREEQHKCEDSFFLIPLSNLDSRSKNQRYLLSVSCLCAFVFIIRHWLKNYGNLNGTRASVICLSYAPPIAAICTCLHWAFQTLPQAMLDNIPQWQQVIMAQIVYMAIIFSLSAISISPLLIYIVPSGQETPSKGTIPNLFNQIKLQMTQTEEEKPSLVYGLGSVYSASVIALCLPVSIFLSLLLNDGVAPSIFVAFASFCITLELYSASIIADQKQRNQNDSEQQKPTWHIIVMLSIFSTVFFYATGHQATVPSIRMEAAFTGFYGNFNSFILPGFLIWTNTFASCIFFGLASPLIILWPHLSSIFTKLVKEQGYKNRQESVWRGDFCLFDDGVSLRKKHFRLFSGFLLINALKLLLAVCAATIHRRHLMVWKIFAPRLVVECAMFFTISVCLGLSFLFVLRVDAALSKFVNTLPSEKEFPRDKTKKN